MDPILPKIDAALIKVTGVFSFNKKHIKSFQDCGFSKIPLSENLPRPEEENYHHKCNIQEANERQFIKDTYYAEFASLMFTSEDKDQPMISLQRNLNHPITLITPGKPNPKDVNTSCILQELFLFDNGIGIFALTFEPHSLDFHEISNLTFAIKKFNTELKFNEANMLFHEFISKEILCGIKLRDVETDIYSGSKFKIYTIINIENPIEEAIYPIANLVYEIGTGARIFTINNSDFFSPTSEYYQEILKNSINVFKNYTGLALLDSFTIIGYGVYSGMDYKKIIDPNDRNNAYFKFNTYNRIYFAIYVINIYIRYNVFRFNSIFKNDPIKTRNEFVDFINYYNYSHISFNFLPNIIYQKMHNALGIDEEVKLFEKRLGSLTTEIQENQNKRQAVVLGILSIITGIGSSTEILQLSEQFRYYLQWNQFEYYSIIISALILLSIPTLAFLFPRHFKKLMDKLICVKK